MVTLPEWVCDEEGHEELHAVTLSGVIGKVMRRMKRQGCVPPAPVARRARKNNDG